ncbi:MAG: hypothetical protein AAGD96_36560, partial [Chloroflexota bacterium]
NFFYAENSGKDYIFRGSESWMIYPCDYEQLTLNLLFSEPEHDKKKSFQLRCTVWAEGLSSPVTQNLEILVS